MSMHPSARPTARPAPQQARTKSAVAKPFPTVSPLHLHVAHRTHSAEERRSERPTEQRVDPLWMISIGLGAFSLITLLLLLSG